MNDPCCARAPRRAQKRAPSVRCTASRARCGSWHALTERPRGLDGEVRAHMRLENNLLFPRAIAENDAGAPTA